MRIASWRLMKTSVLLLVDEVIKLFLRRSRK